MCVFFLFTLFTLFFPLILFSLVLYFSRIRSLTPCTNRTLTSASINALHSSRSMYSISSFLGFEGEKRDWRVCVRVVNDIFCSCGGEGEEWRGWGGDARCR